MRITPLLFLVLMAAASTQSTLPTQPIQWHAKGIVATTQAALDHTECEDAITAKADRDGMQIDLAKQGFSDVLLTDRFNYAEMPSCRSSWPRSRRET